MALIENRCCLKHTGVSFVFPLTRIAISENIPIFFYFREYTYFFSNPHFIVLFKIVYISHEISALSTDRSQNDIRIVASCDG